MLREYQVIFRQRQADGTFGLPETRLVERDGPPADCIAHFTTLFSTGDLMVMEVNQGLPCVDWDKPVWDLDEFAAALGITPGWMSTRKGDGKHPWSAELRGVPRRVAMKWFEDSLNPAGQAIVKELDQAA